MTMTTSESTTATLTRLLTLTPQELVALSIFVSYFLLIISLFVLIGRSLLRQAPHASESQKTKAKWFWCFALISFVYTWNSMIAFLTWSFRDFELNYYPNLTQYSLDGLSRLTSWLINSELFEQAWLIVCSGPMNWWWSEKLCLFTVGYWTIFLSTEGRTHKIPHVWAYMLLGQVVAISVAMNLFYVALSLFSVTQTKSQVNAANKRPVPLILWFSTIASLLTIVYSPYTTPSTFLPNLLTMHAFIVLPLIFPLGQSGQPFDTSPIYTTVIFASVALHLGTSISTFIALAEHERTAGDFAGRAIDTFFEHPAQTSISWDVVCTFVFTAIWEMWASRTSNVGRSELKKE